MLNLVAQLNIVGNVMYTYHKGNEPRYHKWLPISKLGKHGTIPATSIELYEEHKKQENLDDPSRYFKLLEVTYF
jgi:hypothetical protein